MTKSESKYTSGVPGITPNHDEHQTRQQLAEQLDLMFRAIAGARNGVIITDCSLPDDPIVYANAAFEQLTGYSQDEILGRNCRFLQGPATDPAARDRLRQAVAAGESIHIEIQNYRKDGTPFWNDLLISPIYNSEGQLTHFVGNQLDATQRKEVEAALQGERDMLAERVAERTRLLNESRDYLASIVETMHEPLVVLDEELRVLSANKSFYTTFQVAAPDIEGAYFFELGNGQWNFPRLRELLSSLLPNQNAFDGVEVEHDFPAIGRRVMLLNGRQIELGGSKQQRILLAIEDITERKQAEAAARRDGALTQAILGSLTSHIAVVDQTGVIIAVNEAWRNFAVTNGNAPEANAFVGVNYLDVLRDAPEQDGREARVSLQGIEDVLAGRVDSFALEYPCHTPSADLWFLLQVTPLRYEGGGAVIAHIDITEQKQLEQRKDDFISMASHELKTPVTSLKMFTQLLRRQIARAGADALLPQFDKMDAQIDRLTRLIQELLDVSRIYAGKLEVRDEPFDLAELVKDTVETFQATVLEHPITLRGGASGRVRGDSDRIEQVLLNLLGNAVKYSPQHAPVEVMIDEHPTGVIVSVQDQGIGIDPRHHDRIFDRFYQVTDSAEKTFPGLGMGLYISKQILQLHHGDLWVESVKGQGAVFRFKLPLAS